MMEPSLDYLVAFWAIVLSGRIAVPAFPPKLAQLATSLPRIESILGDCEAALVLCHPPLLKQLARLQEASSQFRDIAWLPLAVETMETDKPLARDMLLSPLLAKLPAQRDVNAICFLQYTSGSTSEPKGVEVTHQNILHNSEAIFRALECQNSLVSWLPPFHDMGLIGNVIQTVYGAGTGTFMSPTTFLAKPLTWLSAISRYRAAVSVSPNFGYDYCVQKIPPHHLTGLDLSPTGALRFPVLNRYAPTPYVLLKKSSRRLVLMGPRFTPAMAWQRRH
jgi:acyl-CoA synthetase (AMP-forming)/AMP-acid ligase II